MRKIVIGLGFGDEGKGHVVNWLASKDPDQSVIRYCGGHQVGHCVYDAGGPHIFSNFGSGTLQGLQTFWSAKTCDPVGFVREYQDLETQKGIKPKIWVNPTCPVTTPLDKAMNIKWEERMGRGTIGVGFGATIQREEDNYHLYFQDLFHPELLKAKFRQIEDYYSCRHGVQTIDCIEDGFFKACQLMAELVEQDLIPAENQIYESSQGLMLDMDYGIFPHVTRSQLGTQEIGLECQDELFLVTRAYQTRHGSGWCCEYGFDPDAPDETNSKNLYQGEFKTRLLDLDLLRYALTIDAGIRECHWSYKSLVITCLDHLSTYNLVFQGQRLYFSNEDSFIDFILENLPEFSRVYISHGPTYSDIKMRV